MALREIRLPHLDTYNFGVGVDRLSGAAMNLVVVPKPQPPEQAGGGSQRFDVQRVSSTQDLQQSLGIDVDASLGCASFGAGVSARFSFAQSQEVHSASLFMVISAVVHLADLNIAECVLTSSAASVADNPAVFAARYGDMFARSCRRGGLFVGVMRVATFDEKTATEIEGELRGSYGLFSADAQTKFSKVTSAHKASVYCRVYAEGGPALQLADPAEPVQLLQAANAWLRAMFDDPARYAVPYEWTLSPVSIAEGPLPLNAAELQHAQDVLKFCTQERAALLDQLHLLTWWSRHPDHYDLTGPSSLEQVTKAAAATQADLDLVASCASTAIDSPSQAAFPADYAARKSKIYPSALMPPTPEALPGAPEPPHDGAPKPPHDGVPVDWKALRINASVREQLQLGQFVKLKDNPGS